MRKSVAIWSKHKCVSPDVSVRVCTDSSSSNLEKASVCTHRVHSCVSTAPTAFGVATLMSDPLWLLLSIKLFIQFQDCVCVCVRKLFIWQWTGRVLLCVCCWTPQHLLVETAEHLTLRLLLLVFLFSPSISAIFFFLPLLPRLVTPLFLLLYST